MQVLVIGSGGREHALADKLSQSHMVERVYVAPGNGGTFGQNVSIPVDDIHALVDFARSHDIGLVVVGPELPLTLGVADAMKAAGIPVFGPDRHCARLEGSKSFAKAIMARANVPTARSEVFTDAESALAYARKIGGPLVVKADGLAAGKGVVVGGDLNETLAAITGMFDGSLLGSPVEKILLEEKLEGEEVSLMCLCDGLFAAPLPSAQDHKAVFDGDSGPNTGGMGAYSPAPVLPDATLQEMTNLVIRPILRELAESGHPFHGVLYAGLMITRDGPKVLEYNVRFGDPECQAILPRMESDLAAHLLACANGSLASETLRFSPQSSLGVILSARGYPLHYPRGLPVTGLEDAGRDDGVKIYHSGTKKTIDGIQSSGGRVLCVTALGDSLADAQRKAYTALRKIRMPQSHYRNDIGNKGINRSG